MDPASSAVLAIFSCIRDGIALPDGVDLRAIVVPRSGEGAGISSGRKGPAPPPPYEYEDGFHAFLGPEVCIPPSLSDRASAGREKSNGPEWHLSRPRTQRGTGAVLDVKRRVCTPLGDSQFCRHVEGTMYTVAGRCGEEECDVRVLRVQTKECAWACDFCKDRKCAATQKVREGATRPIESGDEGSKEEIQKAGPSSDGTSVWTEEDPASLSPPGGINETQKSGRSDDGDAEVAILRNEQKHSYSSSEGCTAAAAARLFAEYHREACEELKREGYRLD